MKKRKLTKKFVTEPNAYHKRHASKILLMIALLMMTFPLLLSGCGKKKKEEAGNRQETTQTTPPGKNEAQNAADEGEKNQGAVSGKEPGNGQNSNAGDALSDKPQTTDQNSVIPSTEGLSTPIPFTKTLPENNREYSKSLAVEALGICSGQTASVQKEKFTAAGFTVLLQKNYEKEPSDASHTCAYTIGQKTVTYLGKERPLFLISIRGTDKGEWYSNFDFAPSHAEDTDYAENFLFAAEDVLLSLQKVLKEFSFSEEAPPLFMVCGHSRGAAAANLMAALMNDLYGVENVFAYTFATPNTFRGDPAPFATANIFNVINTCDIVPYVPLSIWGYKRLGTDILLTDDPVGTKVKVEKAVTVFEQLAPSISSYYNDRHSLTAPGLSPQGMTTYELMLLVAGLFSESLASTDQPSLTEFGSLSAGFAQSDFAPLFSLLNEAFQDDAASFTEVLAEHMPGTYARKLSK